MTITGQQLRDARARAGLSQEELGDLLGVTLRTIGNWERGSVPSLREALIRDKLGPYLKPEGEPIPEVDPLQQYSDTALVAEIARRLDAARGKGGQSGWSATRSPEDTTTDAGGGVTSPPTDQDELARRREADRLAKIEADWLEQNPGMGTKAARTENDEDEGQ